MVRPRVWPNHPIDWRGCWGRECDYGRSIVVGRFESGGGNICACLFRFIRTYSRWNVFLSMVCPKKIHRVCAVYAPSGRLYTQSLSRMWRKSLPNMGSLKVCAAGYNSYTSKSCHCNHAMCVIGWPPAIVHNIHGLTLPLIEVQRELYFCGILDERILEKKKTHLLFLHGCANNFSARLWWLLPSYRYVDKPYISKMRTSS